MSNPKRPHLVALAGLAGLIGLAGPAAAQASTAPPVGDTITLIDAGDPSHRILLPGTPTVGVTGAVSTTTRTTGSIVATDADGASAGAMSLDVTTRSVQRGEILSVAPDGTYQMRRLVVSYEVTDESIGGSGESYAADRELGVLVDTPFVVTHSAGGAALSAEPVVSVDLPAELEAAIDQVLEDGRGEAFPAEAVGAGAQWARDRAGTVGNYTLAALAGDDFTLDVMVTGDPIDLLFEDGLPQGYDSVSGTVTQTGRLVATAGDLFGRVADIRVEFDFVLSGPTGELTFDLTTTERQEPAPAA